MFRLLALLPLLPLPALATTPDEVVQTYADIAQAAYGDAHSTAVTLQAAVEALIAAPSPETLAAARNAWRAARAPYLQTEVFRFGNPVVDAIEPRVNSWPLDEGLIDYVAPGTAEDEENPQAALNVISTPRFQLSGTEVDAATITPELIGTVLHGAEGMDANVAAGYHAVEFLLWGQDLNGTGPGAGDRPWTDYATAGCTHGHCDRRAAYLRAATALLVADLAQMAEDWTPGGAARAVVVRDPVAGLGVILTGMGSLSYGELAGERMKLGLLLNDPEEEQDCFSDNTHESIWNDALGIQNVYLGRYQRVDGTEVAGPSLSDLLAERDPQADDQIKADLEATMRAMAAIRSAGEGGFTYDQMISPGNAKGAALVMAGVEALVTQTASIQRAVQVLGQTDVAFEGSDSLDQPGQVAP